MEQQEARNKPVPGLPTATPRGEPIPGTLEPRGRLSGPRARQATRHHGGRDRAARRDPQAGGDAIGANRARRLRVETVGAGSGRARSGTGAEAPLELGGRGRRRGPRRDCSGGLGLHATQRRGAGGNECSTPGTSAHGATGSAAAPPSSSGPAYHPTRRRQPDTRAGAAHRCRASSRARAEGSSSRPPPLCPAHRAGRARAQGRAASSPPGCLRAVARSIGFSGAAGVEQPADAAGVEVVASGVLVVHHGEMPNR